MSLILVVGLLFSPLAAIVAFLIVYAEAEHHYSTKKEPFRLALEAAIFACLFFIAISLFLAWFFNSNHF